MTESSEETEAQDGCLVCASHSNIENIEAQGVVLSGIESLYKGDFGMGQMIFDTMTPYDGHVAITLAAAFLNDLGMVTGQHPADLAARYRKVLNEAQAREAGTATSSDS